MQTALLKEPNRSAPGLDPGVLNVLILEDVELDRWRLRRYCGRSGLKVAVFEADTLARFRRHLDERRFDIAFVDYFLPEGNGFDALEVLCAHRGQVGARPIMITGLERDGLAAEARRFRCAACLNKGELTADLVRHSITSALATGLGDPPAWHGAPDGSRRGSAAAPIAPGEG